MVFLVMTTIQEMMRWIMSDLMIMYDYYMNEYVNAVLTFDEDEYRYGLQCKIIANSYLSAIKEMI